MLKIILLLFIFFTLSQCGTTGGLELPPGVEDKSILRYPPELNNLCEPTDQSDECKDENQ